MRPDIRLVEAGRAHIRATDGSVAKQMVGHRHHVPWDGDTKACPQCRDTLVFTSRYPVLCVGAMFRGSDELRVGRPTHDDIARRAYALHEQRGRADGLDWQDWFQAERELQLLMNQLEYSAVCSLLVRIRGEYRETPGLRLRSARHGVHAVEAATYEGWAADKSDGGFGG